MIDDQFLQERFSFVVLRGYDITPHFNPIDMLEAGVQCGEALSYLPRDFYHERLDNIQAGKFRAINPGCAKNFYHAQGKCNRQEEFVQFKRNFFLWYWAKYFHPRKNSDHVFQELRPKLPTGTIDYEPHRSWKSWVTEIHFELDTAEALWREDQTPKHQALVQERQQALLEIGWYAGITPEFHKEITRHLKP